MLQPQEYIRKYGIEQARDFYKRIENKQMYSFNVDMPRKYKDMIESHDLVEKLNGIHLARDLLKESKGCSCIRIGYKKDNNGKELEFTVENLKKAIADVESCQ